VSEPGFEELRRGEGRGGEMVCVGERESDRELIFFFLWLDSVYQAESSSTCDVRLIVVSFRLLFDASLSLSLSLSRLQAFYVDTLPALLF